MLERKQLSIEQLEPDAVQSRNEPWVGDEEDLRLATSIAEQGIVQDILVRPAASSAQDRGFYRIVAGSRRYHAAMEAGMETVPCKIMDTADVEAAWTSLSENIHRRNLSEQEVAQQIKLIYEFTRPKSPPTSCPDCGETVDGENGLNAHRSQTECQLPDIPNQLNSGDDTIARLLTEGQTVKYIAERLFGRQDQSALAKVRNHLRTAELPPVVQSLFRTPNRRTDNEKTALQNHGINPSTQLGSGKGNSRTAKEIVRLHQSVGEEFESEAIDPEEAVLETVGSLNHDRISDQEFCQTLRKFREEATDEITDLESSDEQQRKFQDTLNEYSEKIQQQYEQIAPQRPFQKVDIYGPDEERYCRWHVRAMKRRRTENHAQLVRQLYQERLEQLAEDAGWS